MIVKVRTAIEFDFEIEAENEYEAEQIAKYKTIEELKGLLSEAFIDVNIISTQEMKLVNSFLEEDQS